MTDSLQGFLNAQAKNLIDACTRCGTCVKVCPVVPYGGAASEAPQNVVGNVLAFLEDRAPLDAGGETWIHSCNGCGKCIEECPESINPRQMVVLAATKDSGRVSRTPQLFRKMSRAIKLMTAMQLIPPEFSKLFSPPRARNVEAVFYVGCNALRTPHLLFNTMYVLDALEIDYEVVGGPSSCCGVIHAKWEGDVQTGERVTTSTTSYFGGFAPERVLNWCPTCELHLGETTKGFGERSYDFGHVTAHFVSRLDDLKKKFTNPIPKRVVLHAHTGYEQVGLDVARLLATIPQLEVVETVYESGYTCGGSGCSKCPELQTKEHGELLARMADTGADVLVTLYHGCHMAFVAEERKGQFEVLNFTDLMAQALGVTPHEDRLKHYGLLSDWKLIAAEAQPYLHANGLDFDSDWIERQLPHLFTGSEFKGDEGCAPFPERRAAKIHFDRGSKSQ